MVMKSTNAISGSFGKVYENGVWLMNVHGFEANGEVEYSEIKRSGTRTVGHKASSISYSGTMQSYHTSNEFVRKIQQIADDSKPAHFTELIVALEDPENPQMAREKYRLKAVQFTNLPIVSYEHGADVEQELQFVFEGFEIITI